MEANGQGDQFKYTTHSMLVSLFLNCPPNMGFDCPDAATLACFRDAVKKGYINWHAAPFNPHYEVFDENLLEFALQFTHDLDQQFGLRNKSTVSLVGAQ